jgi:hypothetical protein
MQQPYDHLSIHRAPASFVQAVLTFATQIHVGARNAGLGVQIFALQVRSSPLQLHCVTINKIFTKKKTPLTRLCRSLFMWYMWRIEDVDISVLQ